MCLTDRLQSLFIKPLVSPEDRNTDSKWNDINYNNLPLFIFLASLRVCSVIIFQIPFWVWRLFFSIKYLCFFLNFKIGSEIIIEFFFWFFFVLKPTYLFSLFFYFVFVINFIFKCCFMLFFVCFPEFSRIFIQFLKLYLPLH